MKYASYVMSLVMAVAAGIMAVSDLITLNLKSSNAEPSISLLTNLGVYILLSLYCLEKAKKLRKELDAEEDKEKSAE